MIKHLIKKFHFKYCGFHKRLISIVILGAIASSSLNGADDFQIQVYSDLSISAQLLNAYLSLRTNRFSVGFEVVALDGKNLTKELRQSLYTLVKVPPSLEDKLERDKTDLEGDLLGRRPLLVRFKFKEGVRAEELPKIIKSLRTQLSRTLAPTGIGKIKKLGFLGMSNLRRGDFADFVRWQDNAPDHEAELKRQVFVDLLAEAGKSMGPDFVKVAERASKLPCSEVLAHLNANPTITVHPHVERATLQHPFGSYSNTFHNFSWR